MVYNKIRNTKNLVPREEKQMKLTAIYRIERNGSLKNSQQDFYTNKEKFRKDLNSNGFKVLVVLNEKEIMEIKSTPLNELRHKMTLKKDRKMEMKLDAFEYVQQVL
jgi:hypothetical protein